MSQKKKDIIWVGGSSNHPKILGRKLEWNPTGPPHAVLVPEGEWWGEPLGEVVRLKADDGRVKRDSSDRLQYEAIIIGKRGGRKSLGVEPYLGSAKYLIEQELLRRFKEEDQRKK